jgi:hypothetical protein
MGLVLAQASRLAEKRNAKSVFMVGLLWRKAKIG